MNSGISTGCRGRQIDPSHRSRMADACGLLSRHRSARSCAAAVAAVATAPPGHVSLPYPQRRLRAPARSANVAIGHSSLIALDARDGSGSTPAGSTTAVAGIRRLSWPIDPPPGLRLSTLGGSRRSLRLDLGSGGGELRVESGAWRRRRRFHCWSYGCRGWGVLVDFLVSISVVVGGCGSGQMRGGVVPSASSMVLRMRVAMVRSWRAWVVVRGSKTSRLTVSACPGAAACTTVSPSGVRVARV